MLWDTRNDEDWISHNMSGNGDGNSRWRMVICGATHRQYNWQWPGGQCVQGWGQCLASIRQSSSGGEMTLAFAFGACLDQIWPWLGPNPPSLMSAGSQLGFCSGKGGWLHWLSFHKRRRTVSEIVVARQGTNVHSNLCYWMCNTLFSALCNAIAAVQSSVQREPCSSCSSACSSTCSSAWRCVGARSLYRFAKVTFSWNAAFVVKISKNGLSGGPAIFAHQSVKSSSRS